MFIRNPRKTAMNVISPVFESDRVASEAFGVSWDGRTVEQTTLTNAAGLRLEAITYGAIITGLYAPNARGGETNLVLGYPTLSAYETCPDYVGAAIGRYAGRIAHGRVSGDGEIVQLDRNHGEHHLHGGFNASHNSHWQAQTTKSDLGSRVQFMRVARDGEGGHSGNMELSVTYTLTDENELIVDYRAASDARTYVNMTQHSYFRLSDEASAGVRDHELSVFAQSRLDIDAEGIPTGDQIQVSGTAWDFTEPRRIGDAIALLDHDYVLGVRDGSMKRAAILSDPESQRVMEVYTDQPALHVYAGGNMKKEAGSLFAPGSGICFETQDFPNAPNESAFPDTALVPGQLYRRKTIFKFSL